MKFERIGSQHSDGESGGGSFVRLKDGQAVTGVFRGPIKKFWYAWPPGGTKQVFDVPTAGAKLAFKVNLIVHEGGAFVAKIYEFGAKVSNQLADLQEDIGDLSKTKIKITRRGSGKNDTNYTVVALGEVPEKALKEIDAVPLHPLEPKVVPNLAPQATGTSDDDLGF